MTNYKNEAEEIEDVLKPFFLDRPVWFEAHKRFPTNMVARDQKFSKY